MRPSEGKVHKSCASLCIRGGIPPAFYVKDRREQKALMIMTAGGYGHNQDLLPYVADPVQVTGQVQRFELARARNQGPQLGRAEVQQR